MIRVYDTSVGKCTAFTLMVVNSVTLIAIIALRQYGVSGINVVDAVPMQVEDPPVKR